MKKTVSILFLSLVFSSFFIHSFAQKPSLKETKVILVNPGTFYLKGITYLTDNKIINISNIEYEAVFYSKSEISYDKAKQFIEEHNIPYIKLLKIEGNLNKENIYKENDCSKNFYKLFKNTDGIIFLGGWDIPPVYYGQKTELITEIQTPNRHLFELSFLFHLLGGNQNPAFKNYLQEKPDYPILGICLGMQSMNVATGGDMYQDIPSDIYGIKYVENVLQLSQEQQHRNYFTNINTDKELDNHSFHKVKFINKQLAKKLHLIKNASPTVCSSHHQAVNNIGKNLKVAATSMDGKVVEALLHKKYRNVLGIQFHPEFYNLYASDAPKVKIKPEDTTLLSEHEMLVKYGSYQFHKKFWAFFSKIVNTYSNNK